MYFSKQELIDIGFKKIGKNIKVSKLARFYSFIDHSSPGYNALYISNDFEALFTSNTDVRKSLVESTGSTNLTKMFITSKFKDLQDRSGDLVFMRAK